jgi:hypothetical protein
MQTEVRWDGQQVVIQTNGRICGSVRALLTSPVFDMVGREYIRQLKKRDAPLLRLVPTGTEIEDPEGQLLDLIRALAETSLEDAARVLPSTVAYLEPEMRRSLREFVEGFYTCWRSSDRYLISRSEIGAKTPEVRPYRVFNAKMEQMSQMVRDMYWDTCENITGSHPRVFHRVASGCQVGFVALNEDWPCPEGPYSILKSIPFIRQAWIDQPLRIEQSRDGRSSRFQRVDSVPLSGMPTDADEWLCYPAQVGGMVVFVYFHQRFMGMGCSLTNLFELASDEQVSRGPRAICVFGSDPALFDRPALSPAVYANDAANNLLVGIIPREEEFGYFGCLKNMILTLHNVSMIENGRLPVHGALRRLTLRGGTSVGVLLIGGTSTGRAAVLQSLDASGESAIRETRIVATDLVSLEIDSTGVVRGFGTQTGAFIRLNSLRNARALVRMDSAIAMGSKDPESRVVLPVTTMDDVLAGYPVDYILFSNNYQDVDESHPIIERFQDAQSALQVFREGAVMSGGMSASSGVMHTYLATGFGPADSEKTFETLARRAFEAAVLGDVFIGQIRTRAGIHGFEESGPEAAAKELLRMLTKEVVPTGIG